MGWSPLLVSVVEDGRCCYRLGHELVDEFLEFGAGRCRPNTVRAYAHDLRAFFDVVGKDPVEVTTKDVFAFVVAQQRPRPGAENLVRISDGQAGLSASTIRRRLAAVSSLFGYLVVRGDTGVVANPVPRGVPTRRSQELARYGVTGVTDATPYEHLTDLDLLAEAATNGAIPQRVVAMGGPDLTAEPFPSPLKTGAVKLLLADHALPSLDELVDWITTAHTVQRPVAAHCVNRASLMLALTALDIAGPMTGDRIEHGAVVPPELRDRLSTQGLTVVTQPNFVAERGEQYLSDVDADDRPFLYPCRSLLDAGVPVAGSTDAPFGHPDPWRAISAAVHRRTSGDREVVPEEAVDPESALVLFLGSWRAPGGPARRVEPGALADLCLLDAPLDVALAAPTELSVRATLIGGAVVHRSEQ